MNRGRRAETIFSDEKDYTMFVALLKESATLWNIHICAYCLMPNHYHLLIQTPEATFPGVCATSTGFIPGGITEA